jgi:4-amino-4-deoxy-L-arabinose transferase-like glycosyltransferase
VLALVLVLTARAVSLRRAAGTGVLLGVLLLIKPSSVLLVAPIAVVWWGTGGARAGTVRLAVTLAAAALVVAPWSIRNYDLDSEHYVPLSVQSAAWYGVFNDDAANDETYPWAWRPFPSSAREIVRVPRSDGELYRDLNRLAWDYVREHPLSVPQAFFWNGLSRLWDVRRPARVQTEARLENRNRVLSGIGLAMYWPLLALAIAGLVLAWRDGRRRLVVAVLATALAASVVYTSDATTRYRAPFEPLVVVLAMSTVAVLVRRRARARTRA